ncbi:MAG: SRPBCC family protein [Rhizobiales bacterium]|nr:SRPBCC family protein [Hyphomicrobiales bacterium]
MQKNLNNAARAERSIELSATAIWAVLADLEALAEWAPGIDGATVTSELKSGVGAVRSVSTAQFGKIEHHITDWEKDSLFGYTTDDSGPFLCTNTRYEIAPNDTGCLVTVVLAFELKPEAMTVEQAQGVLSKGLDATLQALELHARIPATQA